MIRRSHRRLCLLALALLNVASCWAVRAVEAVEGPQRLPPPHAGAAPHENAASARGAASPVVTEPQAIASPHDLAWWRGYVTAPLRGGDEGVLAVDVPGLVFGALRHAPQVAAIEAEPTIRQTRIVEELAAFDWRATMETSWGDSSDPVGNSLTTGNDEDRFREQTWGESFGLRRRNSLGGQLQAVQRLGWQNNNSRFLIPPRQGTTRLELNYSQPLLNSAGQAVNQSQIVLARIDARAASDAALERLQDHLLRVTSAYWELYRVRAILLQRRRAVESAASLVANLQARGEVDASRRQLLRASAAEAKRRRAVIRAANDVRDSESRLRLLVGDPMLRSQPHPELLPHEHPLPAAVEIHLGDAMATALANRAEILRSSRRVRAAEVQLEVAKNAELPKLDLIMAGYVAGLRGESDFLGAYADQFAAGRPSYSLGLLLEVPLGNRVAQAVRTRRESQWFQAMQEFRVSVHQAVHEVEVAHGEVATTAHEIDSAFSSMLAAAREVAFLLDRWQTMAGFERSAPEILEELIDAQDRLADEEGAFVTAEVHHVLAIAELRRAMGTLLNPGAGDAIQDGASLSPETVAGPSLEGAAR